MNCSESRRIGIFRSSCRFGGFTSTCFTMPGVQRCNTSGGVSERSTQDRERSTQDRHGIGECMRCCDNSQKRTNPGTILP
jgi:hypothetical protein